MCSDDKKHSDVGIKLSRTYLAEGCYNEALSLCQRLMETLCVSNDDQLSLSRVVVSAAAAAGSHQGSEDQRVLVS